MAEEYWNASLETLPWAEVENWQAGRIAAMLSGLPARSSLYGRLLGHQELSLTGFADLARLPFTMKDDVRWAQDQADDLRPFGANQGAPLADIVQAVSSSGTTGKPMYYALTGADLEVWTDAIANAFFTAGVRKTDVIAHLVGLPMVAGGMPYADGFRRIGATLCWLGGFPTERILREMRRLRASALLATTSFGLHLTETWDAIGRETGVASSLRTVCLGGEPGLNEASIRERITDGLGITRLSEVMGLGDVVSCLWGECAAGNGMHFNAQKYVAIELIDPETGAILPWREGATGEIVYTTFEREATPLVRYRSRDHALVTATSCSCGRTSPRIRCIGRTDDMLIYKAMNVFPTAIRDLILQRFAGKVSPMLRIWKDRADQVRFDEAIPVDVEATAEVAPSAYPALAEEIGQFIRSQLQVRIAVNLLAPGSVPRGVYKTPLVVVRG